MSYGTVERTATELDLDPVSAVDATLREAIQIAASDIHFDPHEHGGSVRFRIDGYFTPHRELDPIQYRRCLARLKVLGGVVAYRFDIPQEGRIDRDDSDAQGRADLRLSVLPTPFGEKAVVRVFQADRQRLTIDALGFAATPSDPVVEQLHRAAARPAGLVLATGPCSSGKTTTLYAIVRAILQNRGDRVHIASLEDPIECRLPGVTQLEINEAREITFASGLKVLLRQDVNVILIGEIRDAETARIAFGAAFTGHLVLSSMHVADPSEVILRLLHMDVEPYILAAALSVVINQRLLRSTCGYCRDRTVAMCSKCLGSGLRGRFPIGEVVVVDEPLRARIVARAGRSELHPGQRVTPTLSDAAELAIGTGRTTRAEVERVLGERTE